MKDVSQLLKHWANCSNDVWARWFSESDNGNHDFISVNEFLFQVLITERLNSNSLSKDSFFESATITFLEDIEAERSVFKEGKSGELVGKTEIVKIKKGDCFRLKGIDPMGTMLNDKPYAEVEYENKFFLEPLEENTPIFIECQAKKK